MLTPFEPLTAQVANTDSPSPRSIVTLRVILGLSFAAAILISWPMWISSRQFPLVPIFSFIPLLPSPLDLGPPLLLLGCIGISLVRPSRVAAVGIIVITLALWAQDQNRIHPWCYVFILCYAALASQLVRPLSMRSRDNQNSTLQFIFIAVYFWSGFQKVRLSYFHGVTPLISSTFIGETVSHFVQGLFWSAPLLEIGCALLLISRKLRRIGVIIAVLLHLIIITMLVTGGVNYSVIPWNVFMIGGVILLFWGSNASRRELLLAKVSRPEIGIRFLCGVLPALGYFGLWNSYLSFAVYAGASGSAYAFINDPSDALSENIPFHSSTPESPRVKEVPLDAWGYNILRSMPSPDPHVLHAVGAAMCKDYLPKDAEMIMILTTRRLPWETGNYEQAYRCEDGSLIQTDPLS